MTASRTATFDSQNRRLVEILHRARPRLLGLARAGDVIPELDRGLVLHAGPPIAFADMAPAMQAAAAGGLVFDGRARTLEEATELARAGDVRFAPAHDHRAAGAMAGILTASMPVFVVED